jgi:serine/threonine-protein kinase
MEAEKQREVWGFEPGQEIGPGRTVVRPLGGGERYEAWLGWDDHLVSPVVIKVLRRSKHASESARAGIAREARILGSLSHPSLVRMFGADVDGERPYIVLEFLDGPRLSTLLRKFGPLTPEQIVPLATELGSALGYLHNESLLHLDVKPQNVIMGAPPRLIDLSIARRADEVGSLTTPLGTDSYMAPEQCEAAYLSQLGTWTDVWGMGVTLYEAANGYRPFRKREEGQPFPQLTEDPAPFHSRVPRVLADAIRGTLKRDPAERITLAQLSEALDPLLRDARDLALARLRKRVR